MAHSFSRSLLRWYDAHGRELPWRVKPVSKVAADPYRVWLSEIMLQQTTVATVIPYFGDFVARWPTVADLAEAPLDKVLGQWAGLGYYARARNLHKCAGVVASELGGRFPDTEDALRALPGIGPYTAAAIAAIAFGRRAVVVDGNVERVMARFHGVADPLPAVKPKLHALAANLTPQNRAGDYAQSVMDLGATVCKPKVLLCEVCPVASDCAGLKSGVAATLPKRLPKKPKPTRRGVAFLVVRERDRAVLLGRRPEKGLLGGMLEVPSTPWEVEGNWKTKAALAHAPFAAKWKNSGEVVHHTFTHFHLELQVMTAFATGRAPKGLRWFTPVELPAVALPTLMKKVVESVA